MALFSRGKSGGDSIPETSLTTPKHVYCRICGAMRVFTKCWQRVLEPRVCGCCGLTFDDPIALYQQNFPACPRCEEFLEQPTFEYGICDGCGSKFELVEGTPPNLLPNRGQREEMKRRAQPRGAKP